MLQQSLPNESVVSPRVLMIEWCTPGRGHNPHGSRSVLSEVLDSWPAAPIDRRTHDRTTRVSSGNCELRTLVRAIPAFARSTLLKQSRAFAAAPGTQARGGVSERSVLEMNRIWSSNSNSSGVRQKVVMRRVRTDMSCHLQPAPDD